MVRREKFRALEAIQKKHSQSFFAENAGIKLNLENPSKVTADTTISFRPVKNYIKKKNRE